MSSTFAFSLQPIAPTKNANSKQNKEIYFIEISADKKREVRKIVLN